MDIVERLRARPWQRDILDCEDVCLEAADEIERLKAGAIFWEKAFADKLKETEEKDAEIERLRADEIAWGEAALLNGKLNAEIARLFALVAKLQEQRRELQAEVARLRGLRGVDCD